MILKKLAKKIVHEVRKLIEEDIIVANTDGFIIASTDHSRVGTFHEGAFITFREKRRLVITTEDERKLKGVKAGINFPIFFQNEVIGVIGITGEVEKVNPFGELIRKMTELFISENYFAEQFEWQSRAKETFVMDWIQAKEWDDSLLNRARILNVDLTVNRMTAIIELELFDLIISRDGWDSIIKWFQNERNDIVTRWGNERIVILFAYSNHQSKEKIQEKLNAFLSFIKKQFGVSAIAGVGQAVPSLEIQQTFRQAERALKTAKQKQRIIFDEELTLEMILNELGPKTISDYITRTIGSILTEKELLITLKELFKQNHSLKNTSDQLHIHINTLHYRLKKIQDFTELNPSHIHDLLILYLAILLLDDYTKIN